MVLQVHQFKDLDCLWDMFDYDAVMIELWSKAVKLRGTSETPAFLVPSSVASTNMRRKLELKSNDMTGKVRACDI